MPCHQVIFLDHTSMSNAAHRGSLDPMMPTQKHLLQKCPYVLLVTLQQSAATLISDSAVLCRDRSHRCSFGLDLALALSEPQDVHCGAITWAGVSSWYRCSEFCLPVLVYGPSIHTCTWMVGASDVCQVTQQCNVGGYIVFGHVHI